MLLHCSSKILSVPIACIMLNMYFWKCIYLFGCARSWFWHVGSLVESCRVFRCSVWDLVLWLGIEPWPPALGAWSLSHWTTREVLNIFSVLCLIQSLCSEVQVIAILCLLWNFFVVVESLSRVWLCNPVDCSMPVLPVSHYLPESAHIHVHWISDAIQPSYPLPPFIKWNFTKPLLLLFSHSVVSDSVTPWTAARQASLSFTISQSLLKLMSIESMKP